ncbi:MarR family winged helix-turn-helix transcriptional regulator [Nonomuraea sp. MG754425]|uniref:MarR family winged helix-turn-helix transcriptional regulator n=1 Tax=Nonomuraea sp. MG754425 TaxID=2570319 RepID=UPI001F019E5A|nr:MarR family transcriptional regulator [Nonomuraea sp. MG754425]
MTGMDSEELLGVAALVARLESETLAALQPPLTSRQYRLLRVIDQGQVTATAIYEQATMSLASISQSVDLLVQRGLLRRERDPEDGRRSILSLTEAGHASLTDASARMTGLAEQLVGEPEEQQITELRQALRLLRERVVALLRSADPSR